MTRHDPRPRREGWKPVAPGIYEDAQGALHLSVPELLALFEVADTPQNRETVTEAAQRVIAETYPDTVVEVRA